ncbi:BCD family MFS transporter [Leptolyngbya sp. FACHB-36]|uniref:BCD family MFS transporter n=1 Tax=Leptolyngbya sp. FACHB-36 TaxID=2692808 RepID=UPI00168142A5|nr:BCD family MFS transporter [Leptolyngbya sp. FACHB-36]MBD2020231.1 BCD family MFS transporter [Leptolyngbya sp. FACHB-36]
MPSSNFSDAPDTLKQDTGRVSTITLLTMFRLGLFQMGLGMMSVLFLGVLNRAMIGNLAIPATIAAGAIAAHQLVAPARVWFGQMSDAKPLFGFHRTGYVWVGAGMFAFIAFAIVQIMWQLGNAVRVAGWTAQAYGWVGILAAAFALYGLALSAGSTPFAALLVDVSDETNRPKLVGVVWSMLMVGIVIGAILISVLLRRLTLDTPIEVLQASINRVFVIVPAIVFGLAVLATAGVERKHSLYRSRSSLADREDKITFGQALRVLTASRQTGIFFTFLLVMTISLFMQDAVLEPYGAKVFGMEFSKTTLLNAFWGTGTLIGISSAGFFVAPRLGKQRTAKLGCLLVATCFVLLILSGFTGRETALKGVVFLFGLASGITTTGALSLMLDLTAAETAGTFIGAWGLAQTLARAVATVAGGTVLDVGTRLFASPVLAYGLVFALQAVGMIAAVGLLNRVNVAEFQADAKGAIAHVIQGDLD